MLTDTHPEAEAVLNDLWRKKSPAERFARMCELTEMTRRNAKRAIELAHPDWTLEKRNQLFVEVHYGKDLAEKMGCYLREHQA